jgi:hypothetical protein
VTAADGTIISDGDFVSDCRSQPEAWEIGPAIQVAFLRCRN